MAKTSFLVGWALGHKDVDIITLMEVHELQNAPAKMKNAKPKVPGCLACENGINVHLGRKHIVDCRQTILPSLVTDSLWTVKFDADGKVLKRHGQDDDADTRESKRVRFTHKQPDKRADMEMTDDTVAKRTKLFDSPPSSSSSLEIVPNLHDSSGETGHPETRANITKKASVDADVEISAIEVLTNAKLEVDRALDTANQTLHRMREVPLESEAVNEAKRPHEHQRQEGLHQSVRERS